MNAAAQVREPATDAVLTSARELEILRSFQRRIDPTDAGAHNNLGVLYFRKGLRDEAVAAFMRALELDSRMHVAQRNLEIAYLRGGGAELRIYKLREHLRSSPSDRDARWELGRTCLLLGQHREAIDAFTELLKFHPNDLGALIQIAIAQRENGEVEAAQKSLERAADVDPDSSLVHCYLGEVAYHRGLLSESLARLRRSVELNPDNHEAWYLLGFVLGETGEHDEARNATQEAIRLNPSLSRAQANLSLEGASVPTAPAYPRAVDSEAGEQSHLTHYNLATAFRKKGYFDEALREYALAIERGEERDLVEHGMAECQLLRRDTDAALALYEGLIRRQPQNARFWNERGVALHQAGRYEEAQQSYKRSIESEPSYSLALNNIGVALYHAGDPDASFDAFRRALDADPGFVKARLNQALLLFKGRRYQLSLESYRRVLGSDNEHPVAWNGVGLVLAELRKYADARNAFARAIQSRPRYAEAHYNLSFTLSNLGDFEGALRETKLALEIDPYYVPQKLELAIDVHYEDADFAIQPNLGAEKRLDSRVEEFDFDPRVLDSLFTELSPAKKRTGRNPVIATLPTEADPYAMATDFLSKGFVDRAHAEARRALGRGADKARGAVIIGDTFARQALWGEALERYREARRLAEDDHGAMMGEATALLRLGRARDARLVAEALLNRSPEDIETLMLAASSRGEAGDPAAALSTLETARRVAPMRADVRKHIGDISRKLGDSEGAIAAYRDALALDGQYAVVRFQLAQVYVERGDRRSAEEQLLAALDAVPTYAEATLMLAELRRTHHRPDEALPLLIELLQRDPYHFDALIALGETLLALDRKTDAVLAFARVLRFDPEHVGALFHQGVLFAEQRRYTDALERWKRVLEIAPASDFARRARREMRTAGDLQKIFGARVMS